MDIGPGDKVICVRSVDASMADADLARDIGAAHLTMGRIYCIDTVEDVSRWSDGTTQPDPTVTLVEPDTHWTAWDGNPGRWALPLFRKAGREGMFDSLLTAKPVRVGEDA